MFYHQSISTDVKQVPVPCVLRLMTTEGIFVDLINLQIKKYGNDSLSKLFNTGISDGQKIQQIDTWWKEWKASEEKDEERKDSNN